MIFEIDEFLTKEITGVIQIGAHHGQEYEYYSKFTNNILMFEPQPNVFSVLKENLKDKSDVILENFGCGSESKTTTMFVEHVNNGQSSSLLEPAIHTIQYPTIVFTDVIKIEIVSLNDYFKKNNFKYNFISMDVQGYELEVLKGATDILEKIDYIYCEVNFAEMYKNCAMVDDIDKFLSLFNFKRVKTVAATNTWGDALYVKQ